MRYEVVEILPDNTISILLSTGSYDYALRYLKFLKFRYGSYRDFYLSDRGKKYEFN